MQQRKAQYNQLTIMCSLSVACTPTTALCAEYALTSDAVMMIYLSVSPRSPRKHATKTDAASNSVVRVEGGKFFGCRCSENGAFLFASAAAEVLISGGNATGGVADRRAGAVSYRGHPTTMQSYQARGPTSVLFSQERGPILVLSPMYGVPSWCVDDNSSC